MVDFRGLDRFEVRRLGITKGEALALLKEAGYAGSDFSSSDEVMHTLKKMLKRNGYPDPPEKEKPKHKKKHKK